MMVSCLLQSLAFWRTLPIEPTTELRDRDEEWENNKTKRQKEREWTKGELKKKIGISDLLLPFFLFFWFVQCRRPWRHFSIFLSQFFFLLFLFLFRFQFGSVHSSSIASLIYLILRRMNNIHCRRTDKSDFYQMMLFFFFCLSKITKSKVYFGENWEKRKISPNGLNGFVVIAIGVDNESNEKNWTHKMQPIPLFILFFFRCFSFYWKWIDFLQLHINNHQFKGFSFRLFSNRKWNEKFYRIKNNSKRERFMSFHSCVHCFRCKHFIVQSLKWTEIYGPLPFVWR